MRTLFDFDYSHSSSFLLLLLLFNCVFSWGALTGLQSSPDTIPTMCRYASIAVHCVNQVQWWLMMSGVVWLDWRISCVSIERARCVGTFDWFMFAASSVSSQVPIVCLCWVFFSVPEGPECHDISKTHLRNCELCHRLLSVASHSSESPRVARQLSLNSTGHWQNRYHPVIIFGRK